MATKHDLPPFDTYFGPTVQCLRARGGSATIEELEECVAETMKLSEDIRSVPHGDGPRTQFQYELAWVRSWLKIIGAADNSERGVWRLTPAGSAMSDEDIRSIRKRIVAERAKRRKLKAAEELQDNEEPEQEVLENTWKEHLLKVVLSIKPEAFERLCQRVLRESGFIKVEVKGRSGDGGIDGVGVLRVNLLSFHVLFQCKRWKGSVTASTVRDFRGAMVGRADKGLILTTANFTRMPGENLPAMGLRL